jgi:alkylhydroperoxidase/carboxymuconolactone decarboxylase family protein YurZ
MLFMKLIAATFVSLGLLSPALAQGQPGPIAARAPTTSDVQAVSPALARYTEQGLLGDVWKRPGLSPRDRSIVTLATFIARGQTVELSAHLDLALDNGVKPAEISEIVTHLAFYSGWASATAAAPLTREVFARRGIGPDRLPAVSPAPLPLNETAEAARAKFVSENFGNDLSRPRLGHDGLPVQGSVAPPRSRAARPQPRDDQLADCERAGGAAELPSHDRDEQRAHQCRDWRGDLAHCLLRRLGRMPSLR